MAELVIAQVLLRTGDGDSLAGTTEPITAENVSKFRVSRGVIEDARGRLERAGFSVVGEGPGTLSIEGTREQFEQVFGTRLEPAIKTIDVTGQRQPGAHFRAARPIRIPDDFSGVIADVVLPEPPDFFG